MIIQCESCSRKFVVKNSDIPEEGRMVKCGNCSVTWHQKPTSVPKSFIQQDVNESLSVDKIKASDGKTYKFLGSQWAQLLPSGKTGLFARRKISQELDEVTGRKERKIARKRKKKLEELDPSSGGLDGEKQLPDIHIPKQGLGFLGYIFLLIIIGFSLVGVLRTFENDLLNTFPETEYIYKLLDEQLEFLAESVKNMIVIINDLIDSYYLSYFLIDFNESATRR